jgi:hypothetical protein
MYKLDHFIQKKYILFMKQPILENIIQVLPKIIRNDIQFNETIFVNLISAS